MQAADASNDWFGLGPIAVAPDRQGEGIGRALIEAGLAELRLRNAGGCALIGDPALYGRFGFVSGTLDYQGLDSSLVQHLVLDGSADPRGELQYTPAFSPEAEPDAASDA